MELMDLMGWFGMRIDLDEMWGFFDLDAPASRRSMDASDPLLQKLKGKLNRQRLLFHPDKNGHPEAMVVVGVARSL